MLGTNPPLPQSIQKVNRRSRAVFELGIVLNERRHLPLACPRNSNTERDIRRPKTKIKRQTSGVPMNDQSLATRSALCVLFLSSVLGGCTIAPQVHDNGSHVISQISADTARIEHSSSPVDATNAARLTIEPSGMQFTLNGALTNSISVKPGQEVAFRNAEDIAHNLYSASSLKTFDTGVLQKGDSQTVTFDLPGTLDVQCAFHPDMRLTVNIDH